MKNSVYNLSEFEFWDQAERAEKFRKALRPNVISMENRMPSVGFAGLVSLLGQRVPDALAEFLAELRTQTEYHRQLDDNLAALPRQIAGAVNVAPIVRTMSEAFRQQLAATGLQDSAALLSDAAGRIKAASGEINATLQPLAALITSEVTKLADAARQLQAEFASVAATTWR